MVLCPWWRTHDRSRRVWCRTDSALGRRLWSRAPIWHNLRGRLKRGRGTWGNRNTLQLCGRRARRLWWRNEATQSHQIHFGACQRRPLRGYLGMRAVADWRRHRCRGARVQGQGCCRSCESTGIRGKLVPGVRTLLRGSCGSISRAQASEERLNQLARGGSVSALVLEGCTGNAEGDVCEDRRGREYHIHRVRWYRESPSSSFRRAKRRPVAMEWASGGSEAQAPLCHAMAVPSTAARRPEADDPSDP